MSYGSFVGRARLMAHHFKDDLPKGYDPNRPQRVCRMPEIKLTLLLVMGDPSDEQAAPFAITVKRSPLVPGTSGGPTCHPAFCAGATDVNNSVRLAAKAAIVRTDEIWQRWSEHDWIRPVTFPNQNVGRSKMFRFDWINHLLAKRRASILDMR